METANLVLRMLTLADDLDGPLECTQPAYGVPGFTHCAACCGNTGQVITCDEDQAMADAAKALRHAATLITLIRTTNKGRIS